MTGEAALVGSGIASSWAINGSSSSEAEKKRLAEEAKRKAQADEKAREEADKWRIETYWASLCPADQEATKKEALAKAPPFIANRDRQYEKSDPEQAAGRSNGPTPYIPTPKRKRGGGVSIINSRLLVLLR
jgi:hypothetical protein